MLLFPQTSSVGHESLSLLGRLKGTKDRRIQIQDRTFKSPCPEPVITRIGLNPSQPTSDNSLSTTLLSVHPQQPQATNQASELKVALVNAQLWKPPTLELHTCPNCEKVSSLSLLVRRDLTKTVLPS